MKKYSFEIPPGRLYKNSNTAESWQNDEDPTHVETPPKQHLISLLGRGVLFPVRSSRSPEYIFWLMKRELHFERKKQTSRIYFSSKSQNETDEPENITLERVFMRLQITLPLYPVHARRTRSKIIRQIYHGAPGERHLNFSVVVWAPSTLMCQTPPLHQEYISIPRYMKWYHIKGLLKDVFQIAPS